MNCRCLLFVDEVMKYLVVCFWEQK